MGSPALGYRGYIQIGREAVWNVAVPAATRRIGYLSFEPKPQIQSIDDATFTGYLSKLTNYKGYTDWNLKVKTRLDYFCLLNMWDALFGTNTFGSVGGITTGALPYQHTYNELSFLNSYTIEAIEGDITATSKGQKYTGCICLGVTVKGTASPTAGMFECEWEFWSPLLAGVDAAVTAGLSFQADAPSFYNQIATVNDGTNDAAGLIALKTFELIYKNTVDTKRFVMNPTGAPLQGIRDGLLSVSFKGTKEYQSTTLLSAANNQTKAVGSGVKLVIGSSVLQRMTMTMPKGYLKNYQHKVDRWGILTQDFEWEALQDQTINNFSALQLVVEDNQNAIS